MNLKTIPVAMAVLIGSGAIASGPCIFNNFVNWDDPYQVLANPLLRSLSLRSVGEIFSSTIVREYHPITTISYALDYHFWGLDPFPYHAVNVLLHLLNGLLVLTVIKRLTGNLPAAFAGGLFFTLHPAQAFVVASVSARKDLLCTLFYLGALLAFMFRERSRSRIWYPLSLCLFLAAALSKTVAVTFPVILILLDVARGRRLRDRVLTEKLPFFVIAVVLGVAAVRFQHIRTETGRLHYHVGAGNLILGLGALRFYLRAAVFPVRLLPFYPLPPSAPQPGATGVVFLSFLLTMAAIARRGPSRKGTVPPGGNTMRLILFGLFFFIVGLLPVIRVIPFGGNEYVAVRFLYLPLAGGAAALGVLYGNRVHRLPALRGAGLMAAVCSIALFWSNCLIWRDSFSFWETVLRSLPRFSFAHHMIGAAHYARGDWREAANWCAGAIDLNPAFPYAYLVKGLALQRAGETEAARVEFLKVKELFGGRRGSAEIERKTERYLQSLPPPPGEKGG